mgnify:CR=1 FL=1
MLKIKKIEIDLNSKPKLIAEISANHAGKLSNAIKLVKSAAENGSDLIKLQTYDADSMTINSTKKDFFINNEKSIWKKKNLYHLYKSGTTPKEWHKKLFEIAKKYKTYCFTSIFDENDIEFLEKLNVPAYKIASFECLHFPLIEKVAKTKKPLLISTGLTNLKEINNLIKFLKKINCKNYALLKCTSSYPADKNILNLKTISDMRKKFRCEIGYSDHSIGFNAAIGAIHQGASFIEKHICLNNNLGLDSKFSLPVKDIKNFKKELNDAYLSKGKIIYGAQKEEKLSLQFRRSIYAVKDIKKNENFSRENIRVIRPGYGLEPSYYNEILKKKAKNNIKFATPIKLKHVKK